MVSDQSTLTFVCRSGSGCWPFQSSQKLIGTVRCHSVAECSASRAMSRVMWAATTSDEDVLHWDVLVSWLIIFRDALNSSATKLNVRITRCIGYRNKSGLSARSGYPTKRVQSKLGPL